MASSEFSREFRPKSPDFNDDLDDFYRDPTESGEKEFETVFEADLADMTRSLDGWHTWFNERLVETVNKVPEGFTLNHNTDRSPMNTYLIRDIELQHRGAPIVFCAEAYDTNGRSINDTMVSIFVDGVTVKSAMFDVEFGSYNGNEFMSNETSQAHLISEISRRQISYFYFDTEWRTRNSNGFNNSGYYSGFRWAEQNGMAESAFMTTVLYGQYEMSKQGLEDLVESETYQSNRQLYEKFAAELDENGNRKYWPLSLEQIAGMAVSPLYQTFQNDLTLNERLKLEKPFPIRDADEDSY